MRFVLSAVMAGLMATAAGAVTIEVPDEDLGITEIQQAVFLADPGDTVLVMSGVYDSVYTFATPLGIRDAIVSISSDIVLLGADRGGVVIDHAGAEYGILVQGVGGDAVISNLTITGGASRDKGRTDDGDGRFLAAGIACLDAASPTITDVDIENGATGIVVRTSSTNSAPHIEGVVVARGSHHAVYIYENGTEPVDINKCTFVQNFDYGVYVNGGEATIRNSAITHNGKYGVSAYLATPSVSYCNVYWNDTMFPDPGVGPRNYYGMDDMTGTNGNISAEPYYCDLTGDAGYNYAVCISDPVSPHFQAGEGGVTIGALEAACTGCQSPVEPTSWGAIKAIYR